jgi:hypothetical protein
MVPIYQFQEHCLTVSGEKKDLLALAAYLRNAEGTLGDLRYQIEYAFDVDGVRSSNLEDPDHNEENYEQRFLIHK